MTIGVSIRSGIAMRWVALFFAVFFATTILSEHMEQRRLDALYAGDPEGRREAERARLQREQRRKRWCLAFVLLLALLGIGWWWFVGGFPPTFNQSP